MELLKSRLAPVSPSGEHPTPDVARVLAEEDAARAQRHAYKSALADSIRRHRAARIAGRRRPSTRKGCNSQSSAAAIRKAITLRGTLQCPPTTTHTSVTPSIA